MISLGPAMYTGGQEGEGRALGFSGDLEHTECRVGLRQARESSHTGKVLGTRGRVILASQVPLWAISESQKLWQWPEGWDKEHIASDLKESLKIHHRVTVGTPMTGFEG